MTKQEMEDSILASCGDMLLIRPGLLHAILTTSFENTLDRHRPSIPMQHSPGQSTTHHPQHDIYIHMHILPPRCPHHLSFPYPSSPPKHPVPNKHPPHRNPSPSSRATQPPNLVPRDTTTLLLQPQFLHRSLWETNLTDEGNAKPRVMHLASRILHLEPRTLQASVLLLLSSFSLIHLFSTQGRVSAIQENRQSGTRTEYKQKRGQETEK